MAPAVVLAWLAGALVADLVWDHVLVELAVVVGLVSAYTTAGALILSKRERLPADERTPWSLLAVGMLMVAVGMMAMAGAALVFPQVGAFGPMDMLFLAAYAVGLTGFALLPQLKQALVSRRRLLLDGLIGAVSIAALMWVFLGEALYAELTESPTWDLAIGSLYPVLDLAGFLVVMLVVLRRSAYRFDPRLMAVGFTFLIQGFGDVLYFRAGVGTSFQEADPLYTLHLLAAASLVYCGLIVDRRPVPREFPDRQTPWLALLAPYGAALLLVGVTGFRVIASDTLDAGSRFLLAATFLVVVLVVVRQLLAIAENREVVERERDALVSSISHELRTPLTAVVGSLELLGEHDLTEGDRTELVDTARREARQLSRMVGDLILAARESPVSVQPQRRDAYVADLIAEAVRLVDGPGTVEVACPPDLAARVDPDRVRQALINLVSNARRYGSSRCRVVARRNGQTLVIEVHDDGPGVPERHRETIWKRFERGAHRLDAALPGSGIGLAVVDLIAQAHGGTASYRPSEVLGGACFQLSLPDPLGHLPRSAPAPRPSGSPG